MIWRSPGIAGACESDRCVQVIARERVVMKKIALGLAAAATVSFAPAVQATTLIVNGTGQLTGAMGVAIGGSLYDVSFVEGTCAGLFGGCTSSANFTFQSLADATAASTALLTQVFNPANSVFDIEYQRTYGCGSNGNFFCAILTPYGVGTDPHVIGPVFDASVAGNTAGTVNFTDTVFGSVSAFDSGNFLDLTWARYTLTGTAVPEPRSWAMMLLGFAGIGLAIRRKKLARPAIA
jgi:hypothetical protein